MNKKIFQHAKMSDRLDLAELALTMAVIDREPWAIKYMLSTQGQERGYIEKQKLELSGNSENPVIEKFEIEFVSAKKGQ